MNEVDKVINLFKPESLELTIVAFCIIVMLIVIVLLTRSNTKRARIGNENHQAITKAWQEFVMRIMDRHKKKDPPDGF